MPTVQVFRGRFALALTLAVGSGWPGRTSAADEPAKPGGGVAHFMAEAAAYRVGLEGEPPRDLALSPEPILKWSNPVRGTADGAVLLWTDRGRPEAVASFYRYTGGTGEPREAHEFTSLATGPMIARFEGQVVWTPRTGIEPTRLPDAPPPASTAVERLRQMRSLAQEFRAYFDNPPDQSEVRLLPQPLHRYDSGGARRDVVDGALFAFVHTTDPEVLLLIEARVPEGGGPAAWHYAVARMTTVNVVLRHRDREVWRAHWATDAGNLAKPYFSRDGDPGDR